MMHFFEQIDRLLRDAEWAGILITVLIAVLILSLIAFNITGCICAISMRKSLKKIANKDPKSPKPKDKEPHTQSQYTSNHK